MTTKDEESVVEGGGENPAHGGVTSEAHPSSSGDNRLAQKEAREIRMEPILPLVPKGLPNFGNTCFFNATLQCLLNTEALGRRFDTLLHRQILVEASENIECPIGDKKQLISVPALELELFASRGSFRDIFATLIGNFRTGHPRLNPRHLFDQIARRVPRFRGYQQQDAQELLIHLIDGLREEEWDALKEALSHIPTTAPPREAREEATEREETQKETKGEQATTRQLYEVLRKGQVKSLIDTCFGGSLQQRIICLHCGHHSTILEPFLCLSLPLSSSNSGNTTPLHQPPARERAKKQHRKRGGWKGVDDESFEHSGETEPVEQIEAPPANSTLSKYQQKREAKKKRKKNKQKRTEQKRAAPKDVGHQTNFRHPNKGGEESSEEKGEKAPMREEPTTVVVVEPTVNEQIAEEEGAADPLEEIIPNDAAVAPCADEESVGGGEAGATELREEITFNGVAATAEDKPECTTAQNTQSGDEQACSDAADSKDSGVGCTTPEEDPLLTNGHFSEVEEEDGDEVGEKVLLPEAEEDTLAPLVLDSEDSHFDRPGSPLSLLAVLQRFTEREGLVDQNAYECGKCSTKSDGVASKRSIVRRPAVRRYLIYEPPLVLSLHLKRFEKVLTGKRVTTKKFGRRVDYPLVLDLAPFCCSTAEGVAPGQKKVLYSLYGIVSHSGGLSGGHYIAYVKAGTNRTSPEVVIGTAAQLNNGHSSHCLAAPHCTNVPSAERELVGAGLAGLSINESGSQRGKQQNKGGGKHANKEVTGGDRWYCCNDNAVTQIAVETVKRSAEAYILFYERIA